MAAAEGKSMNLKKSVVSLIALLIAATPAWAYYASGIIDPSGKIIAPCQYYNVRSLGHGLFFLEYMHEDNPIDRTYAGELVDHEGHTITVNIPQGSKLSQVFLPYEEKPDSTLWRSLPAGTVLQFKNDEGFGLCRQNGATIMAAGPYRILEPNCGFFPVCGGGRSSLLFTLDSATGKRVMAPADSSPWSTKKNSISPFCVLKDGRHCFGYMRRNGEIAIAPQFGSAGEFSDDGIACVSAYQGKSAHYIDTSGRMISPVSYPSAQSFIKDYAMIGEGAWGQMRYGLIDKNFRVVLPPTFHSLGYLFDHTYFAQEQEGGRFKAITAEGKTVFEFPENVADVSIAYGNLIRCQTKPYKVGGENTLYVDRSGKTVNVPTDGKQRVFEYGLALVVTTSNGSLRKWQLEDRNGKVLIPSQTSVLQVVSADRIIKSVPNDHFNPTIWKNPNPQKLSAGLWRVDSFTNLLADYDLIGMPKETLIKLIGQSDRANSSYSYYNLCSSSCGFSSTGLEFDFADGKVLRWREVYREDKIYPGPWITTNVIYDQDDDFAGRQSSGHFLKLIAKPKR